MPVNVHLLDSRIGGGVGKHGAISSFVRVIGIIKVMGFLKGFQLFDDTVGILGIVLSHPSFDTGSIKQKHGSFIGVNLLADRFGQINKMAEHGL